MSKPSHEDESTMVRRVRVRLLAEEERPEFDRLLEERHDLQSARLSGQTLRYVAELDGVWVALVCFGAAALHLKAREKRLGWSPRQRARRLKFVVGNSRFLVLPERGRYPNLASRVLALCLRRLDADWRVRWGHPVLAVESFVDESRHPGTCYRACGFEALGMTQGYGRASRDFYCEHGKPKQLYLRELQPGAAALLRRGRLPGELAEHEENVAGPCPFRAGPLGDLRERFLAPADARKRGHGMRHRQASVLACAAAATLLGAGGYAAFEDVCGKFTQRQLQALGCWQDERGRFHAPSDSTFYRVLSRLDAGHFEHIIAGWLIEQAPSELARLAVDGKTLRGSGRTDGRPLQLLSAVTHRLRLTLGSVAIAQKSNEPERSEIAKGRSLCPKGSAGGALANPGARPAALRRAQGLELVETAARPAAGRLADHGRRAALPAGERPFCDPGHRRRLSLWTQGQPERHPRTGRVQALPAPFFPLRKTPPGRKRTGGSNAAASSASPSPPKRSG